MNNMHNKSRKDKKEKIEQEIADLYDRLDYGDEPTIIKVKIKEQIWSLRKIIGEL